MVFHNILLKDSQHMLNTAAVILTMKHEHITPKDTTIC